MKKNCQEKIFSCTHCTKQGAVMEGLLKENTNSYWDLSGIFLASGLHSGGEDVDAAKQSGTRLATAAKPCQMAVFPDNAGKAISFDLMPLGHLLLAAFVCHNSSAKRWRWPFHHLCRSPCREEVVFSSSWCHRNEISASECLIYSANWGSSWHCFDLFIILQGHCLTIQPLLDSLDH